MSETCSGGIEFPCVFCEYRLIPFGIFVIKNSIPHCKTIPNESALCVTIDKTIYWSVDVMPESIYWRNRELREHVAVIDGEEAPTIVLKNGTYLNTYTKQWLRANIWMFNDRIVYVGDKLPENSQSTEIVDCDGQYLIPGYIEPHAHPFQLYNPEQLAMYGAEFGTTAFINDNLMWNFLLERKKAFTLLEEFERLPVSMYWWARFDSQTALQHPA